MQTRFILAVCLILSAKVLWAANMADLVRHSGIQGGIVVHLDCGDGRETSDMLLDNRYLVQGLDPSSENVSKARSYLRSKNLYGLVSVARYDGKTLPNSDNLVNLVVAGERCQVASAEITRVLVPGGVAVLPQEVTFNSPSTTVKTQRYGAPYLVLNSACRSSKSNSASKADNRRMRPASIASSDS